tara:strand:+ start:84019 stop:86385 length:2367 start_codon:yes stop_codon:yes gene_type:complete
MENKIENMAIPANAKIKVYWNDKPENYSRESRNKVKNYFSKKYGIPQQQVNIIYRPVKIDGEGNIINIDGGTIDNIMNIPYQRELFKEWLERENNDVSFERIIALDNKVNSELNLVDDDTLHKKYRLTWLMLDNFLSFGDKNFFPIDRYKGFTVVNSSPANQGGKTVLTIDAVKYLFFGTTSKTNTNEQVFNQFREKNEVTLRGMLEIEGEDGFIIERHLKRTAKRKGGWNVKHTLNYYRILPDGEEDEMEEEDATKTTQLIKDTVGTEKDFDMVALATYKNLDDMVDSSSTESGKLLTRFIGLEVIAQKEKAVRSMYNIFAKTMKSNIYDVSTLNTEIDEHRLNLTNLEIEKTKLDIDLNTEKETQTRLTSEKMELVASKIKIDSEILSLSPSKLETEIGVITNKGVTFKTELGVLKSQIEVIGVIDFDEDKDFALNKGKNQLVSNIAVKQSEIDRLNKTIEDLIAGGICQSCHRELDDVDNTEHIDTHKKQIEVHTNDMLGMKTTLGITLIELGKLKESKDKVDEKNKLELRRDRVDVEMGALRNNLISKKADLKKYNANVEAIDTNKEIDINISMVDTNITVCETQKDVLTNKIQVNAINTSTNNNSVATKLAIIKTIERESEVEKIFKIYIDMIGKKGISKLVLRSVLPIINGEIQRLLEDVTNFDVEVFIDDKNEVRYLLIKDGIEKPLKSGSGFEKTASGIALRCVLGKMSSLPTPNFIAFDEVLGRVAPENISLMKPLFDKVSDMFDIVFFISQNDLVKDWGDNIITVNKDINNVSSINIV